MRVVQLEKIFKRRLNSNKFFSGKHKMFAIKFEILANLSGRIVKICKLYLGPDHDFKIRMNEFNIPPYIILIGDFVYFGYEKIHKKTITPTKRKKNQKLSKEIKARNREIPKQRMVIEHGFA